MQYFAYLIVLPAILIGLHCIHLAMVRQQENRSSLYFYAARSFHLYLKPTFHTTKQLQVLSVPLPRLLVTEIHCYPNWFQFSREGKTIKFRDETY
jgi:hypothetical protein